MAFFSLSVFLLREKSVTCLPRIRQMYNKDTSLRKAAAHHLCQLDFYSITFCLFSQFPNRLLNFFPLARPF